MKHVMVQFIKALMVVFIVGNITAAFILPCAAATQATDEDQADAKLDPQTAFAIALVVGISCLAAGYAVARVGSAAIGAESERPEMFGRSLVFVGLAEGIAIYGLIIGIMLMRA